MSVAPPRGDAPLLRMHGIEKSFPGVKALRDGRLTLQSGEIHALMGENGAGKSTLLKTLSGAYVPDSGTIEIDGAPVKINGPADSRALKVAVIYQEFNLVPDLSIRENVFLGRETTSGGFLSAGDERARTTELLTRLKAPLDPETPCGQLSVAHQQMVEIAKALSQDARILVMDEPTAAISGREVDALFEVIRDLKARGIGIVYVSHRLDEIFHLCDAITVMRDGAWIATKPIADWTRPALIETMVGRALDAEFPIREPKIGAVRLEATNLSRGKLVQNVSLTLRAGEIVGLTGLVGAGRTEVARLLFGADPLESGTISFDGKPLKLRSPQDAIRAGICLLTEDRKRQGLVLDLSLRENFGLPNLVKFGTAGFVDSHRERGAFQGFIDALTIRTPSTEQRAGALSGGNQQKVVLAKWLEADADVFLFDEPTRGVDVGAKYEIYVLMNELAARGKCILMISSELPEALGMSDRILVMREGKLVGELPDARSATQEDILRLAVG